MTQWFRDNEDSIFRNYSAGELVKDVESFVSGRGRLSKVLHFFFDRLRYTYTRSGSKYTPMQVLNDENLLELLWKRVDSKPNMFPQGRYSVDSFRNAISVGWSHKCNLLANFPAKEALAIYRKYCPAGGLVYDPSAGFGSRMSAALLGGYSYVATDPNKDLFPLLEACADFLFQSGFVTGGQSYKVYCQGSEVSIPALYGKVDFAFTSPPYFNLEKYSNDTSASTRNYGNFKLWVKEYVAPTILNIKGYLKPGACVGINIKSTPRFDLYGVWRKVFHVVGGFKELEPHSISISRRHYNKGMGETLEEKLRHYYAYTDHELCMVFQKE
jgi:hypothetical protein